jgi:predicted AlkP superfamily pyrophosphatase or phosphodiesterase
MAGSSAQPTVVVDVVGLTPALLAHAPRMSAFAARGRVRTLAPVLPAVTCSVQSSMLTGAPVREHGIVGNGWYDRDLAEVHFWKQSNRLVQAEKVWETARRRDPSFTCANMFWWYNMHSTVDVSVTPRPMYLADGRKIPDVYSEPADLRETLQAELGRFPLFKFWGPASSIESTRWIAAASRRVHETHRPDLMLIYLPHLDYDLQRLGPDDGAIPAAVAEVDAVVGDLIDWLDERGVRLLLVSEYGIEPVTDAVLVNRMLRDDGLLRVREEHGHELLDAGASRAFAVADHQVAHVYVKDAEHAGALARRLEEVEGVGHVLDRAGRAEAGIDHARAGDLVLVAAPGRWFAYDYWEDDARAPDFARTVDIHRKPGYDPRELFIDPELTLPMVRIAGKLLRKRLGFRTLMDVIPLDNRLVRGSHGRVGLAPEHGPLLIAERGIDDGPDVLPCTAVRDVILRHLFDDA